MTSRDAAFLWETEALRKPERRAPGGAEPPTGNGSGWSTLREAYSATGIPLETIRKWARRGAIPSYLDDSVQGTRRMVKLSDVEARARSLGRPIAPVPEPAPPPPPDAPAVVVDLTEPAATAPVDAGPDQSITSNDDFNFSGSFSDPGVVDNPWSFYQDHTEADIETTREDLHYTPDYTLEQGIEEYAEVILAHLQTGTRECMS